MAWTECIAVLFIRARVTGAVLFGSPPSQANIQSLAYAIGLVVVFWTIVELSCFLAERISVNLVGRRKTRWNRKFKGTWLWGSPIGFALATLISSSLLRWLVVALSVLGCFFAIIFRLTRPHDEI